VIKNPQLVQCTCKATGWELCQPNVPRNGLTGVYFLAGGAQQPPVGQGLLIHEVSRSQRRTTVGRTPLDEWLAHHRDLYLTTHNTRNTEIHAPLGFEPTISVGKRQQTYAFRQRSHWDRLTGVYTFQYLQA